MGTVQAGTKALALLGSVPMPGLDLPIGRATPDLGERSIAPPNDRDFAMMRTAYAATGGIARASDLARLREEDRRAYCMSLEKLIALGWVFGFEWRGTFWVPMFQFELHDLRIRPGPRQVLAEVASVRDGWSLAVWFVRPCPRLDARSPVDLLDSNLPEVVQAARDDRCMLIG